MLKVQKNNFPQEFDSKLIQAELYDNYQEPYNKLIQTYFEVLDYDAPLKSKKRQNI